MSFRAEVQFNNVKDVAKFKEACRGWKAVTEKGYKQLLTDISCIQYYKIYVHLEDGMIQYELVEKKDSSGDSSVLVILERWASEAAFEAHLKMPHVADAIKEVKAMGLEEPDISRFNVILSNNKD